MLLNITLLIYFLVELTENSYDIFKVHSHVSLLSVRVKSEIRCNMFRSCKLSPLLTLQCHCQAHSSYSHPSLLMQSLSFSNIMSQGKFFINTNSQSIHLSRTWYNPPPPHTSLKHLVFYNVFIMKVVYRPNYFAQSSRILILHPPYII